MESAGEFGQQPFTNISDPIKVRTLILQQRREFEEGKDSRSSKEMVSELASSLQNQTASIIQETAPAQAGGKDRELEVIEGLSKLDDLRQSGALTEGEFLEAKKELLDKLHQE